MIIKNHNGATAIEFAIILPLLILVLFGIIEFSLVLFNKHIITNASREGARAGIVSRGTVRFQDTGPTIEIDTVDVKAVVDSYLANHLITFGDTDRRDILVEIWNADGEFAPFLDIVDLDDRQTSFEDPLKVTVTYDYEFLVLSIFGFGPITLDGTSEMRME
jgi:hypothetical protein